MTHPVFDNDRTMRPEWLTVTQAAAVLTDTLRGGAQPYTRQAVDWLCQHKRLPFYTTPLGRLIHASDLLELVESRLLNAVDTTSVEG